MPAPASQELQPSTTSDEHADTTDRDWFLLDCTWHDTVWTLRPTNILEENPLCRLSWSFPMPSHLLFTDDRYASLLERSRRLIAAIRRCALATRLPQRASTIIRYFLYLRVLLQWMDGAGFSCFADLDTTAFRQFQRHLAKRTRPDGRRLAPTTVEKYLYLFAYLYRFRDEVGDGLTFDPFPGCSVREVAGLREADIGSLPHTPDAVAATLVKHAVDLVNDAANDILAARQIYANAMASAEQREIGSEPCCVAATRALQDAALEISIPSQPLRTVKDLARAIDMLYAACFVVIAYLVGPRASEILHLKAGCVQRHEADPDITVIVGALFKKEREYYGRPHQWVAPPPAVQAITVLEALSEAHRRQTGRDHLWLRTAGNNGAREWRRTCERPRKIMTTGNMVNLLQRFAAWLALPHHDGEPWRITTHQGRKTFVRFAAMRDRSNLFAIAQHLGHRERAVTDTYYCGSDHRLNREIEAEILEQSVTAWEQMLTAPSLGGRAGEVILAKRPHFKGAYMKEDVKTYARMLTDAGLSLGVCDWGYCVYREEDSACLGNAAGPNPVRREPSTCARCRNFAVGEKHRPYWLSQAERHEALLHEPALPRQTLRIARHRFQEARAIVRQIDTPTCK